MMAKGDIWRGEQCPSRKYGLTHTQDTDRFPDGSCIHCGVQVTAQPPPGVPENATEAYVPPPPEVTVFDHLYQFALNGKCLRCGELQAVHATHLIGVEPGACTVAHDRLVPWQECGQCKQIVEPKLATGTPSGPNYGPGRFPTMQRHKWAWEKIRDAFQGGYWKS
jgi:hypothetical protein